MIKLFTFIIISTLFVSCLNKKISNTEKLVCGVKDNINTTFNIDDIKNQPEVYRRNCAACHLITKDGTGPKLIGVFDKIPSEKWFELYIKNEDSLLKKNNKYAVEISKYSVVNNVHKFINITNEEMIALKKYIRENKNQENLK